ncbi:MAG TPA: hypothetical protein VFS91_01215, partial [Nitrobacter sp.]|nr:hypothetical protein [Nitrobacter sp.]
AIRQKRRQLPRRRLHRRNRQLLVMSLGPRELSDIYGCDANRQTGTEGAGGASCVARESDDEAGKVRAIRIADGDKV